MKQISGFKKLDVKKAEDTYGGNALLLVLLPFIIQSVVTAVASIKSIFSEKGSIKGKDISAQWDDKTQTKKTEPPVFNYFAY